MEEENSRLLEELKSAQSQSRRARERVNLDIEDNENRLRQSERSLRDIENRLNDSQNENDRLHDKIQGTRISAYLNLSRLRAKNRAWQRNDESTGS